MKRGLIASCSKKRKHFALFYYVKSLQYDAWDKIIKLSSQFYREDNLRKIFTLLVLTKANMIHSYDSWFFLNKLWAIGPNLLRQLCLCCTCFYKKSHTEYENRCFNSLFTPQMEVLTRTSFEEIFYTWFWKRKIFLMIKIESFILQKPYLI